jgi:allantoin racemase
LAQEHKYRFCLVPAFTMPENSRFLRAEKKGMPKEQRLMNYNNFKHLLEDVDWDLHDGAVATYGDWPVENREEFCYAAAARLPIIHEVCKTGKYNAIVLLGGGEPGLAEAKEIARKYNVPVTSCAFAQMYIATTLGNKFSVIDISELHNMYYYDLVVRHHLANRCASIRNLEYPMPRPGYEDRPDIHTERHKAQRGEASQLVDIAVDEAVAAIEEDGAEVITLGCATLFWLQPFLQQRLCQLGWEVPVLEGYSAAIALAKLMVDLKLLTSGLTVPADAVRKWRRKKVF